MKKIIAAGLLVLGFAAGYVVDEFIFDVRVHQEEDASISDENGSFSPLLVHDAYVRKIEDFGNRDILGSSTLLRATDSEGRHIETKTTPVVLEFFESYPPSGYYVVTTGHKPGGRNFDEVTLFEFTQDGPIAHKTIAKPGYGKFVNGKWFYIQSMNADVTWGEVILQVLDGYGREIDSWKIGETLSKDPSWKNLYRLTDIEILETEELILSFEDDCGLDVPYPVCARYLVDVNSRTVYSLPTQPHEQI